MRPDHVRLGVLAVVALLAFPCSTLAQTTTSTDAAIAELRQLLADQRAALDRQARIIEEQGRTLAALQQRVEGTNRSTEERLALEVPATTTAAAATGAQAPVPQQPTSRTAAEPTPDLPAMVVSAGDFPGSIRIPGTESAFKLGGQARMVAVHTLSALGTEDRFVTSSIPVGVSESGRGGAHGLLAHRESLEHRAADAESERADAPVHRDRLRRRRPDVEASARVPPDQPLRRRPDLVHVFGSGGRHHRH